MSRPLCGRFMPMWRSSSTRPGRSSTSSGASTFRPSPAPTARPTSRPHRRHGPVIDFKFGRRARARALSRPDDDGADVINAQLMFYAAARATRFRNSSPASRNRSDHRATAVDRTRTPKWCRPSRSRTPSSTSSSRSIALPVKRRSRRRRGWSGATVAGSARQNRSALHIPDRCSILPVRGADAAVLQRAPRRLDKAAYLQVLATWPGSRRRGQGHRQSAA